MTARIVVLGAGYAGLGAAKRVARRLQGADAQVTLVNASDRFVERVRLHQLAAGQPLPDLPLSGLLDGTGVELVVARVTGLDLDARAVRLDAAPYSLSYDVLIYALGSDADTDGVPGIGEHAFTLASAGEAARIRYVWQNISLGRHDGVTQVTRADDSPLGAVLTGRASATFKEAITRGTVWRMRHPGPYGPGG
ncbi:FAD-dependent oxidoreductase [Nonomuraea roseola]|uniref:FAD-dependent oxidoreductase n=1 Tax=Nonomuraea roseola TaxID=46179 RepID=A0ABV5PWX5_9ACTN